MSLRIISASTHSISIYADMCLRGLTRIMYYMVRPRVDQGKYRGDCCHLPDDASEIHREVIDAG